ncbi:hypothetical protein [Mesorhizobium amorphae]|uniref:hypothetical protein n=1 Tax=Mesorhizobium amorphae TaxID=71433 RepID=UPI00118212A1|nr:hypothetical protein [Mesorhizobium amorphae]
MTFEVTAKVFNRLKEALGEQGRKDIAWAEKLRAPKDAEEFALKAIWVISHAGMMFAVGQQTYDRVQRAVRSGASASSVFRNRKKSSAMDAHWVRRAEFYRGFQDAAEKVEYCSTLPYMGRITKFHLAKDCGVDVAKPDVHLQRLADRVGLSVQEMCERFSLLSKYRVATVDVILWRACSVKVLNSITGEIRT